MTEFILALDQGTTTSRAMLFTRDAKVKAIAQKPFRQIFPSPGWVEHDPTEIWATQAAVAAEVMAGAGIKLSQVAAIGITNQRETTIVWERKTGRPIMNAIVWQDRRTTEICQMMKSEGLEPFIQKKTGLLLDPYFSASKIRWILEHIPGAEERAKRGELAFGTIDSWLVWKLTEGAHHITDVTNASRTMLFNIHTQEWDEELLSAWKIPREMLPKVCSCSEIYAETTKTFLAKPIPISGIAGDQQSALFGQACFNSGMVKTTYGTGCFMLMNTGEKPVLSKNKLLTTIAYKVDGKTNYALEGSVFIGGAVVQWLRDSLGLIKSSAEVEKLAASVPDNNGVYFVPAFTGLGAPYWDPYARGQILGLTRGTTGGHLARAALEGIAFQVTDVLLAMEGDAMMKIEQLRVDGGAVGNNLLMQFQADLLSVPTVRPLISESTAMGAAFLAGLAVKFWKDEQEIASYWRAEREFTGKMPQEKVAKLRAKWKKAIECAQLWEEKDS
ncbi:MAG: glycerol kinase GlpK [Verrucomicrobia bacterium]|nr:glycerol kinase GlpK [Verrucomicrobiota bacterium]